MATKRKASPRRAAARRKPTKKCCPCAIDVARAAFKAARTCGSKRGALTALKAEAARELALRTTPGGKRLLYQEMLKKQAEAAKFCAREEHADSIRFNGFR